ncbi:MAG: hypothetical protein ACE366_07820 [Bradymonadia bacterium]
MIRSAPARRLLLFAAFLTLIAVGFRYRSRADISRLRQPPEPPSGLQNLYVPSVTTLRMASAGYEQAAADLLWVRVLGYFGSHFKTDRQFMWLETFVDQIIALDPMFREAYETTAMMILYGSNITNESVASANRIYEAGMVHFPDDPRMPYNIGFNLYFEMKGETPQASERYRLQALDYFTLAASMPEAPLSYRGLLASLQTKAGRTALAQQHYLDLYLKTDEPAQKAYFRSKLEEAGVDLKAIEAEFNAIDDRRKATHPYMTFDQYMLLDEQLTPPSPANTWTRLHD